jgi:hypothetical protein
MEGAQVAPESGASGVLTRREQGRL